MVLGTIINTGTGTGLVLMEDRIPRFLIFYFFEGKKLRQQSKSQPTQPRPPKPSSVQRGDHNGITMETKKKTPTSQDHDSSS